MNLEAATRNPARIRYLLARLRRERAQLHAAWSHDQLVSATGAVAETLRQLRAAGHH